MGKTSNRADFRTQANEGPTTSRLLIESDGFTQRRKERGDSIN
jgi:hypothetical protein